MSVYTGDHGEYGWLASDDHDIASLLRLCPEVVLDKYVAITSFDSGPLGLNEDEKQAGWLSVEEIAYSPRIKNVQNLPHDLYDEWYVFCEPRRIGTLARRDKNIFEEPLREGQVRDFVNFGAFHLHRPDMKALTDLFWQQLPWISPESYIADGECLAFVSLNNGLFSRVKEALSQ